MADQNYLALLNYSFKHWVCNSDGSRFEFLSEHVFCFVTEDSEMSDLFGKKALEVCSAISNSTTFEYIQDDENYRWYLLLLNTPFFKTRISWGVSIRGAWWDECIELESLGLLEGDELIDQPMKFSEGEWNCFVKAMQDFAEVT